MGEKLKFVLKIKTFTLLFYNDFIENFLVSLTTEIATSVYGFFRKKSYYAR